MVLLRFEPIETDHLVIRPMHPDDVDALWRRRNDPSTAEFQGWAVPYPRDKAQQLVDGTVELDACPPPDGWIQLAVDDRESGSPIGDLAIGRSFDGRSAEIGWSVDPDARGRGVATESASALVAWLFEAAGVSRVQAMTHPDNLASARVAERLGMVLEGHTRNSYWVGDENSDDWIFGMTHDDWRAWVDRSVASPESVELTEITHSNLRRVERLATHRSQQRFVSPVASSFADVLAPAPHRGHSVVPWYRAVEADGEIVGFVMATEPTAEVPVPYLWRLLIDRMHQRRGVGGRVLDLLIERVRVLGADELEVSWVEGPGSPGQFYLARGFEPTGEIDDGEIVARFNIS